MNFRIFLWFYLFWFVTWTICIIGFVFAVVACAPLPPSTTKTVARVTFYDRHEDRFGSRIAIGGRAHEGTTMAAPAVIPFGTPVTVPALDGVVGDGCFVIQDRGTALEKAYRRGQLRLDVYVASRKKLRQLKYGEPEYMEAEIK